MDTSLVIISIFLVNIFWIVIWLSTARQRESALVAQGLAETKTREVQIQMEESVGLTNQLIRAVQDPLLVLDTRQLILIANPKAEGLWGRHLVGETLMAATRNFLLDDFARRALKEADELQEQIVAVGQQTFKAHALSLKAHRSEVQILVLQDVTELQILGRARRDMVSNISHELRTPITAINLLVETLLTEPLSSIQRELMDNIRTQVETLAQLAQEMQDLSMIEMGQMPIKLVATEMLPILESSVQQVKTLAESKEHRLEIETPPELTILADANALQRAIKNIVHNAVKFCPPRSHIRVVAMVKNDEVHISVIDNGPGIDPEDMPRVFERFFQGDRSRADGTGLGLAIARHIVNAHGGKIWVESTPGHGATFIIALPLGENAL